MLKLVIGASGSGKSAFAENLIIDFGEYKRVYAATMQIFDDETKKRVHRHREMRAGKNFQTIECPICLENIAVDKDCVVLLECMSNLVANEMFSNNRDGDSLVDIICNAIHMLEKNTKGIVIVTNDVFSDGHKYEESTEKYMRLLAKINITLAGLADEVYEVVSGVPVKLKYNVKGEA